MVKKVTKHVELLNIEPETPLRVRKDGEQPVVAPMKPSARRKKFDDAQEWAHKKYANAFRKLAQ